MIAEIRNDIAISVQPGLVLPMAARATSIFMHVNIRLWEAGAGRLIQRRQALRYRSVALPISCADGAPANSVGCRERRHRGAEPGRRSRRSRWRSSTRHRQPFLRTRRPIRSLATRHSQESFWFFPFMCVNAQAGVQEAFARARSRAARRRCRRWLRPERLAARGGDAAALEAGGSTAGAALSVLVSAGLASMNSSTARPFSVIRHSDARLVLGRRCRASARERQGAWYGRPSHARSSPESPCRA